MGQRSNKWQSVQNASPSFLSVTSYERSAFLIYKWKILIFFHKKIRPFVRHKSHNRQLVPSMWNKCLFSSVGSFYIFILLSSNTNFLSLFISAFILEHKNGPPDQWLRHTFPTVYVMRPVLIRLDPRVQEVTRCCHLWPSSQCLSKSVPGHSLYLLTSFLPVKSFIFLLFNKHSSNELNGRSSNQYCSQRCSTQVVKGQMLPKYRMREF